LAIADQELAPAYYAAITYSATPDALKADERAWIVQRNNSASDAESLRVQYRDRINMLESLARQEAAATAQ
jgi:uncharacterized protein